MNTIHEMNASLAIAAAACVPLPAPSVSMAATGLAALAAR